MDPRATYNRVSRQFQAFYDQMLEFARDQGLYRPGERARKVAEEQKTEPRQLGLFG